MPPAFQKDEPSFGCCVGADVEAGRRAVVAGDTRVAEDVSMQESSLSDEPAMIRMMMMSVFVSRVGCSRSEDHDEESGDGQESHDSDEKSQSPTGEHYVCCWSPCLSPSLLLLLVLFLSDHRA